ncbi:MAG: MBL fold metallo-hydrolase [Actinomycetota bacterium]|jgi:glyoxylase-like metal-dependent hydrolase (beta-lactamase superfamily II)
MAPGPGIERVVTSGVFALDGQQWEVENNVWLVGDENEVIVVDAAHEVGPIVEAVAGRRVTAIVLTHGHNDHINAALPLAEDVGSPPVWLHPEDTMLWRQVYPAAMPTHWLADGQVITGGGVELTAIHTPGHSPGGCCFYDGAGHLFSGDTLFEGGPGNTSRSFSHFPTIIASVRDRLLGLPPETVVHTGHGNSTTIGAEAPHLGEWVARGH